ncbi:MAG: hypothetical protein AAF663_00045 [Planctomycetota bacterium]
MSEVDDQLEPVWRKDIAEALARLDEIADIGDGPNFDWYDTVTLAFDGHDISDPVTVEDLHSFMDDPNQREMVYLWAAIGRRYQQLVWMKKYGS